MVWGDNEGEGVNSTTIAATVTLDDEEVKEVLGEEYTDEQAQNLVWGEIDKIN